MKKILLTAVCLIGAVAANAQWYVGPQLSLNFAGMSHASEFSTNSRIGYAFGAFGGYEINDHIAVEGQLMYSAQGVKLSGSYEDPDDKMTYSGTFTKKMNYINVPIVAKFTPWRGLYAFIGPQFGFNVRSKIKGDFKVNEEKATTTIDVKSSTNVFDMAGIIGIGYQFDFGFRAGISYSFGFSNTVKDSKSPIAYFGDPSTNRVLAISIGWKF